MPRADIEIRFALLMLALAAILAFHDPSGAWDALTTAESEVVCSRPTARPARRGP
jgi:hypothetical protein